MRLIRLIAPLAVLLLVSCAEKAPQTGSGSGAASETGANEPRIAALSPAVAVMLRDLGLEDRIVARHDFDKILSDTIPRAGSSLGWDLEVLIGVEPTHLVFQRTTADLPDRVTQLAGARGWTIVQRPLDTLDDIASFMDDLALLFDERAEVGVGPGSALEPDFDPDPGVDLPGAALGRAWRDRGPIADRAGRVLILGSLDPPAAMGPGSFHHQLITRMGMTPAIQDGAMWIEIDYEDIVSIAPDSIIVFAPDPDRDDERFGLPGTPDLDDARDALGPIAELPTPASESGRLGVIDHPLALLPASSLAEVARETEALLESWDEEP